LHDGTLKLLNSFLTTLFDFYMNIDGITGTKRWNGQANPKQTGLAFFVYLDLSFKK